MRISPHNILLKRRLYSCDNNLVEISLISCRLTKILTIVEPCSGSGSPRRPQDPSPLLRRGRAFNPCGRGHAVKINSAGAAKSRTLPHKAFIYTLARCEYVLEHVIPPAEDNARTYSTWIGVSRLFLSVKFSLGSVALARPLPLSLSSPLFLSYFVLTPPSVRHKYALLITHTFCNGMVW